MLIKQMIFFRWAFANDRDRRGKCWTGSPPEFRSNLLEVGWGTWLGKCVLCTLAGSAYSEADKILPPGQIFTFSGLRLVPNCGWIETHHHFALYLLELAMRLRFIRFHGYKRLFRAWVSLCRAGNMAVFSIVNRLSYVLHAKNTLVGPVGPFQSILILTNFTPIRRFLAYFEVGLQASCN